MRKRKPYRGIPVRMRWLAGALIVGLFVSCNLPPSPVAPEWETELNLPLLDKSYNIFDEVVDSIDEVTTDSLGNLFFMFESVIDSFSVGDQLTIDGMAESFSQSLGTFSVSSQEENSIIVQLKEIFPQAELLDGLSAPVPAFQFDLPPKSFAPLNGFEWVEIASGTIQLRVVNNLPISLGKPTQLVLRDGASNAVITSIEVPDYVQANGGEYIGEIDLSGKRITKNLIVSVTGGSPGSAVPVPIHATDGFEVHVSVSNFVVTSAAARIGTQHIAQSDALPLADSVFVKSAKIRTGAIAVNLTGSFPIDTAIDIKLPDFTNARQETLAVSVPSLLTARMPIRIDLAGYTFAPQGSDFGDQQVQFRWELTTLQPSNDIVVLNASDYLAADFVLSDLAFEQVSGKFKNKRITIPRQTFAVDVPSEIEKISFEDARLELTLLNTINFPANTDLQITGKNKAGQTVTMGVQALIQPGEANGTAVPTTIRIDRETNSTIVDLLNLLPDSVIVTGQVELGNVVEPGTIRRSDVVSGTVKFTAPLAFELPAQSIETDASKTTIDTDVQSKLRENLMQGALYAKLNSHLPLGASIELCFAATDTSVYTNPQVTLGPITLEEGFIDPNTGLVSAPQQSDIALTLSKEQIDFFARDTVYSGLRVTLPGTGNQTVRLLATDYLDVKAYAKFQLHVNDALTSN